VRTEFLLLFLVVGAGNYLMRFLPLLWTLRRGEETGPEDAASGSPGRLLPLVGPSVVVALLVTSILPGASFGAGLIQTGIALLPTLVAARSGNLGLTVLVGVAAYWMISLIV
jgi:branched-subunit amino acid transport protein